MIVGELESVLYRDITDEESETVVTVFYKKNKYGIRAGSQYAELTKDEFIKAVKGGLAHLTFTLIDAGLFGTEVEVAAGMIHTMFHAREESQAPQGLPLETQTKETNEH